MRSDSFLADVERASRNVSVLSLELIAKGLGVSLSSPKGLQTALAALARRPVFPHALPPLSLTQDRGIQPEKVTTVAVTAVHELIF